MNKLKIYLNLKTKNTMELTIGQLIKIIMGVLVFVVVVGGVYLFFKNYVIDFIKNVFGGEQIEFVLCLLKAKMSAFLPALFLIN